MITLAAATFWALSVYSTDTHVLLHRGTYGYLTEEACKAEIPITVAEYHGKAVGVCAPMLPAPLFVDPGRLAQ